VVLVASRSADVSGSGPGHVWSNDVVLIECNI
jgi:hypothetical protein